MEGLSKIRVPVSCLGLINEKLPIIESLFKVRLYKEGQCEVSCDFALFGVEEAEEESALVLERVQDYVDKVCGVPESPPPCGSRGEDSSYDSDLEPDDINPRPDYGGHSDVSRTTSDSLSGEYVEGGDVDDGDEDGGYASRLEFALKLGYTEDQVQRALDKLGTRPGQNELLAELIRVSSAREEPRPDTTTGSGSTSAGPPLTPSSSSLRPIIVDGSNVAMSHGNKLVFSCRGIKLCVDWFKSRGHTQITVFVPKWRKEAPRPDTPITDQHILSELERDRLLVFTPSRLVGGKRLVCYDDRYILKLAAETSGIVVSNDNYRDLAAESPMFKKVVEQRLLMYSFVNDRFMPPDDPLGRSGPTLDRFLRQSTPLDGLCPYGKKCTYGNKCKFGHPERPARSISGWLVEQAARRQVQGKSLSVPLAEARKPSLARTRSGIESTPRDSQPANNLHRKLCRQLSLHPGGADPRLQPAKAPLARHKSYELTSSSTSSHLPVSRIASAPPTLTLQEARSRIHYHLSSIFPEDQVRQAMAMYPEETSPEKICAAILLLHPPRPL